MGLTRAARRAAAVARLRAESGFTAGRSRGPVYIHIGELVLHGFPRSAARAIGDGLEGELTRLFTAGGVSPALTSATPSPRLDAGSIHIAPGVSGRTIGTQIGRAVYGGGQP